MIQKLRKMRAEKGFTLAELLVVVLIIGILATVAIVFFTGQTDKANEAAADANLRSAYAAAQNLYLENGGNYGDAAADVVGAINTETDLTAVTTGTPGEKEVLVTMDAPVGGVITGGELEVAGGATQGLPRN